MSIRERMKLAIAAKTRDRTRYVQLKEVTGISGDIWKNFWFDRREPDALMLEALARAWPDYAFWLVTGATNVGSGHLCPSAAFCFEPGTAQLITDDALLKAGVEAAKSVEKIFADFPEDEEKIAAVLHGYLNGDAVHFPPKKCEQSMDIVFKKVKAFNHISKLRSKEAAMQHDLE